MKAIRRQSISHALRRQGFYYLCAVPLLVVVVALYVYPVYQSVRLSFTNYSLLRPNYAFIGIENYVRFLTSGAGRQVLTNTMVFTLFAVLGQAVLGLTFALIINREFVGRGIVRSLLVIPIMIAPVVMAYTWRWMYHDQFGIVNYMLMAAGVLQSPIGWASDPAWAMPAVIFAEVWYGTPFATLVFLGGLQSLPPEPYEAATVDGASGLQRFRYLTLPLLKPVLMALVLLRTMISFQAFDLVYVLTYGGPGLRTEVMNSFGYKVAFKQFQFGYGAATTMISLVILVGLGLLISRAFRANAGGDS